jgi:hypothetical protein
MEIEKRLNVKADRKTVRRFLLDYGLRSYRPKINDISEINRQKRVEFAKNHAKWTVDDGKFFFF